MLEVAVRVGWCRLWLPFLLLRPLLHFLACWHGRHPPNVEGEVVFFLVLYQVGIKEVNKEVARVGVRGLSCLNCCLVIQVDLHNTGRYKYFGNGLSLTDEQPALPNGSEHKAMCAFILAAVARDYYNGQMACLHERIFDSCFDKLDEGDFLLRQWSALCVAQIWDGNDEIKVYGVDRGTQDKLILLLSDDSPEVRAAAMYALGTFIGASGSADPSKRGGGGTGTQYQLEERIHFHMEVAVVTGAAVAAKEDANPMLRKELLILISCLVKEWRTKMGAQPHEEEVTAQAIAEWLDSFGDDESAREESRVLLLSSFFTIFAVLLELTIDPYHEVATNAWTIMDYILALLLASLFYRLDCTTLDPPLVWTIEGAPQLLFILVCHLCTLRHHAASSLSRLPVEPVWHEVTP